MMMLGFKRPLEQDDLPDLAWRDSSENLHKKFEKEWNSEIGLDPSSAVTMKSFAAVLARAHMGRFVSAAILKVLFDFQQFVGPLMLSAMITYLQDVRAGRDGATLGLGLSYVAVFLINATVQTGILHQ